MEKRTNSFTEIFDAPSPFATSLYEVAEPKQMHEHFRYTAALSTANGVTNGAVWFVALGTGYLPRGTSSPPPTPMVGDSDPLAPPAPAPAPPPLAPAPALAPARLATSTHQSLTMKARPRAPRAARHSSWITLFLTFLEQPHTCVSCCESI